MDWNSFKQPVIIAAFLLILTAPAFADQWDYLQNDKVKIGVIKDAGACVAYFSRISPARNLINHYDWGREVQQSFYGNRYSDVYYNNQRWYWNPVQAGDVFRNPSRVLEYSNDGTTIYAKVIPKDWAQNNIDTESLMEEWVTLNGDVAHIRFKFTYTGSGSQSYGQQEVPAIFLDADLGNLVWYKGSSPWTNGALTTEVPPIATNGELSYAALEKWAAYVDSSNWGMGAYMPESTQITTTRGLGSTGELGESHSYMAGNIFRGFSSGQYYEYNVYLTIGTISEIRSRFYSVHDALSGPVNGACGSAQRTYIQGETFPGNHTLCSAGTPPGTTPTLGSTAGATVTWTCAGINGGIPASCNATRSSTVNGVCGPAAKAYSETEAFPNGAYCSPGTAYPFSPTNPAVGSSTSWTCAGSNGGTNVSCTASRATVPTAGLVGYWALNEGSGSTTADGSGNGNTGTLLNGPTWTTGKIGNALSFDGSNDEVDTTLSAPANSFTFGAWMKATTSHENDTQSTSGYGGTSGQRYAFGAVHRSGSDAGAGLSVGTNGISVYEHGDNYMPATLVYSANIGTGWTHVMVVYNNRQPTLYINGTAVKTGLTSPRSTVYAPVNFGCGEYGCFSGAMDEVRIYNRALSASEVQQVYLYTGASLNYHPADTSRDWALSTGEVSTYNLCWKTPTCTPSPPTTYVSNANLMWKSRADGTYYYAGGTCPLCWVSGAA